VLELAADDGTLKLLDRWGQLIENQIAPKEAHTAQESFVRTPP